MKKPRTPEGESMDIALNLPPVEGEQARAAAVTELLTEENLTILNRALHALGDGMKPHMGRLEATISNPGAQDPEPLREAWAKMNAELNQLAHLRNLICTIELGPEED